MNTKILFVFAISLFGVIATNSAQYDGAATAVNTLKTNKGTTYRDVLVVKAEDNGLTFRHENGIAKVLFEDLSANLQDLYGYDPSQKPTVAKPVETPATYELVLLYPIRKPHLCLRPTPNLPYPLYLSTTQGRANTLDHFLRVSGLKTRHW